MGWFARKVAVTHGRAQPRFESRKEAEHALLTQRDDLLTRLHIAARTASVLLDYSPESLKPLERWSFQLYRRDAFGEVGFTMTEFESAMRMYAAEIAVRAGVAEWFVEEHPFAPGHWEIGVRKHLFAMMTPSPSAAREWVHWKRPNNKKETLLYRDYQRYWGL